MSKEVVLNDLSQRSSEYRKGRGYGIGGSKRVTMSLKEIDDKNYIKDKIDYTIQSLVYDNKLIKKCYSYYNSKRDLDDFAYLTDNYGLGNPEELKFTPITRERVNILIGILLSQSLDYDTDVADGESFKLKEKEKSVYITNKFIQTVMNNKQQIEAILSPEKMKKMYGEDIVDVTGDSLLTKLLDKIRMSYTDNFQQTSQSLVGYAMNSHTMMFAEDRKEMFKHLIVSGMSVFEKNKIEMGIHPTNTVLDSRDVFLHSKNNEIHVERNDAIVVRKRMTKHDVILEYGSYLTKKEIIEFLDGVNTTGELSTAQSYGDEYYNDRNSFISTLYYDYSNQLREEVYVDVVEYKEEALIPKNKTTFNEKLRNIVKGSIDYNNNKQHIVKQFLYRGVRAGSNLYINIGRVANPKRRLDEPYKVDLSFRGINLNKSRNYVNSIVYDMIDIQDMYDIIRFHERNIIANGGNKGTFVNMAAIPKEFGNTFDERLLKYIAYMKQGFAAVNPTQAGAEKFNNYGSFDNGLDGNALNSIQMVLQSLEQQADIISGVNAPMRGQIEQREAVHNVKVGIRQVSFVTKEYYHYIDILAEKYLMAFLDSVKEAFPDGISFSYNEGLQKIAYKALPKYYNATNYVVSIKSISENAETLMKLQATAQELASAGVLDPMLSLEIQAEKSIKGILSKIKLSIKDNEAKNNVLQQMKQQLDEASKQSEEISKEYAKAKSEIEKMKSSLLDIKTKNQLLEIEAKKAKSDNTLKEKELEITKDFNDKKIEEIEERTRLEREQLYNATGNAKEVRNDLI